MIALEQISSREGKEGGNEGGKRRRKGRRKRWAALRGKRESLFLFHSDLPAPGLLFSSLYSLGFLGCWSLVYCFGCRSNAVHLNMDRTATWGE